MNKRKTANKYLKMIRDGDTAAFDDLYKTFYCYIRDVAFMSLYDKTHVEDVVMATFEAVLKSVHGFDEEKSGYAWLVTIAKNSAYKINRDEYKYDLTDEVPEVTEEFSGDAFIFDGDGKYNVIQALKKLDPLDRKIVWLRLYEDKTFADISRKLGMTYIQVYDRYAKALETLKKFFEKR